VDGDLGPGGLERVVGGPWAGAGPAGANNADLAAQSLGTGAYRIDEFIPGEISTVFERNENYWQPDLPKVDFFEVITIPEVEAQLAAIRGGQIDILSRAPAAQLDALDAEPDIMVISNPVGSSSVAYCQIDVPPFDNNDLRLAIKYATNRPQHNDLVYGGRAYQMNDIPLPGLIRFGLTGSREHNLAMAREHLSRAGYADGIDLTLTLASMEDWIEWTQVWQQQLAEAGINVELNVTPADTYWGDQWLSAPFAMTGWNVRTVDHGLGLWYHAEAEWNETHWADEQFDADIEFVTAMLRYQIDVALFGVEEARRNLFDVDPQIRRASALFDAAERLLEGAGQPAVVTAGLD